MTNPNDDLASSLRSDRARLWKRVAIPALSGEGDPLEQCREWSASADALLTRAFEGTFGHDARVGLFALGKLGSYELNLSSDVDILLVSENDDPSLLASLRAFQKILAESRADGFVFRVDFDLRPGGRMGPLIPTVDHLIDYYGNYGETWERLAFVRLRFIAGSSQVKAGVTDFTRRFVFRRHLDFGLLEDLKNLRGKMLSQNWKRAGPGEYDLKLGLGGIRDIELFTHALLVIHGGKDPSLQNSETVKALALLAAKNLLPATDAAFLSGLYSDLRRLENYVQAVADEQTHLISKNLTEPAFVATLLGPLEDRLQRCRDLVSGLLGTSEASTATDEIPADLRDELMSIPILSRNKERDEETRKKFLARFLALLDEQGGRRDWALDQLRDFLKAVRAKGSFFSLLVREERLVQELAWIFGHSRYLGRLLCFRPELLDSFAFRSQDLRREDLSLLLEDLTEKRLLAELVEGSRFLRDHDVAQTTARLSSVADEIGRELALALKKDIPSDIEILCLGKWGGCEMGFRSDLDFLFVVPNEVTELDHKFAKRFISRLTEPHRGGSIYPIDLRLRPSGKAGPIVIPIADLQTYLANESAVWERQAYLRARWLDRDLGDLKGALFQRSLSDADLQELDRIREGLVPQGPERDLKLSAGGLVDLELFAQTHALLKKQTEASNFDLLAKHGSVELARNYGRLRQYEQILHLVTTESSHRLSDASENTGLLASVLHLSTAELSADLDRLFSENIQQLERLDPRRTSR